MIRFALKCENNHRFDSWFASGAAFDALNSKGMLICPECGSAVVTKDLMAPKVSGKSPQDAVPVPQPMANAPDPELVEAVKKLKAHVEKTSDYVGSSFAREARAMHEGDIPHRAIYGEAKPEDAKKLIEDGVPALPLPFVPKQKTN